MSLKRLQREGVLRLALLVCAAGSLFFGIACDDDPPMKPPPVLCEITLTLVDVGVTEAVIRVAFPDSIGYWTLSLRRDGQTLRTLTVQRRDTILTDQELTPSRTYTYQVVRMIDSMTVRETSNDLLVTTEAPTSSAFQWSLDSLAGGTSSYLQDVAIIRTDPPLIYAVGDLFLPGESKRYNLAVWDGSDWSIERIPYRYQGKDYYNPIETIIAFGERDMWFAGNGVLRWDGAQYIPMPLPSNVWGAYRINKIWGTSSSNIYIVGDNGSIAHYNGSTWRKIESGTTLPIRGIYGAMKEDGSGHEILCVADSWMEPEGSKVIKIEDNKASEVWNDRRDFGLESIWFIPGKRYIVVGDGFWETDSLSKPFRQNRDFDVLNTAHKHSIYGINEHDIVVAGSFKLLAHFNGYEWNSFFPVSSGAWAAKMKGDLIVAVGSDGRYALTAIGRR